MQGRSDYWYGRNIVAIFFFFHQTLNILIVLND